MGKKLTLDIFKNDSRWHLDGQVLDGEHVVMVRDGHELHGRVTLEGGAPPGKPVFQWQLAGDDEFQRVDVNVETDTFRRADEDEQRLTPLLVRRLH